MPILSDSDSDSDVSPFSCKRKRPRPLDDSSPDDKDSGSYPATASVQSKQSPSTELLTPSSVKSDCSSSTGRLTPASVKSEHTTSRKLKLATPPGGIKKLKMEEQSLPDPYEFPDNFRPDVELALSNKQLTKETAKAFISRVAAHIFTYKKYPSQDEYVSVARAVIAKYPFMKSPTGRPIVSLDIKWYI